ncbi:sulfite exporter TauE/SafE family protein [Candidatus Thorarchaeota archaeon]|nr:MAG: sulfite exporter TauE/SafE family protein [Candidatus Thorarchaeota archaeon]
MQELFIEILPIVLFAVAVGTISSMVGIGGGIINTPLLIIVFALTEQQAPATALVAALFVAIASTVAYGRQNPTPIVLKAGLFLAVTTIPGSLFGVALRELITEDYVLRLIFGISLFPVAIKMLFARKRGKADEVSLFDFNNVTRSRLGLSLIGGFVGGAAAGLLGIGGGAVVVPVLTVLMGLPIHAAVATSMFTMMFTASAGTLRNYVGGHINPFLAIALGIGMIVGAQIGTRLACKVNAVELKRIFGLVLVFPLVKMMKLGQIWLDPLDTNFLLATIGDIIIWLAIVIPVGIIRFALMNRERKGLIADECEEPPPQTSS